jgi:predicted acetyltransferase
MPEVRALAVRVRVRPMIEIEIREPAEDDREQVAECMRVSLNLSPTFVRDRAASLPLHLIRCAFDGDRVVAVSAGRHFRQWFGGREIGMNGIWGVTTLPENRGTGLASRATGTILREARANGEPLSALYPATLRPYRGMGYEIAGTFTEHRIALDDLPRGGLGPLEVEEYDAERDLDSIRACYRAAVAPHNGPIDCDDPDWWPQRILGHSNPDDIFRAVVARGSSGAVRGYAAFIHEKAEGDLDVSFQISCKHLVATTIEGYASILGYLRGFRGLGQAVTFPGAPADPMAMLVEEQRVKPVWTFRWMLRILDVPAALEARGYPSASGSATIVVEDPMFSENRGPWTIEADAGKVSVTPAETREAINVSVGTLSSMYSGFLSPLDARRLGLLHADDRTLGFLASLFSGSAPFMYDFF